jgi:hypothetical protein
MPIVRISGPIQLLEFAVHSLSSQIELLSSETQSKAVLPRIAADNLLTSKPKNQAGAEWMKKSNRQNSAHAGMAYPEVLNALIWFACTGNGSSIPRSAQLPAYQAMRLGIANLDNEERASKKTTIDEAEFDGAP